MAPPIKDEREVDPVAAALGRKVVGLRMEAGLAPAELAGKAGMSAAYLWRLEDGRQNVNLRTLVKLAVGLGVTLSALFEGIEVPANAPAKRAYVSRRPSGGPRNE